MNERGSRMWRRARRWAVGIAVALAVAWPWLATHHVVRTPKGTVIVSKRFVTLKGTFVDVRPWQWQDVDRHPSVRDALVQSGYRDLLPQPPPPQGTGARLVRAVRSFGTHTLAACCRRLQKAGCRLAGWLECADAYWFAPRA